MSAPVSFVRARLSGVARRVPRQAIRPFASTSVAAGQSPGNPGENFTPVNDPNPGRGETPNVSKTNEMAVDNMGVGDNPLQEYASDAEKMRVMQAPNRKDVWSRSQMPREMAMSGPRFEQTIMEVQPRPQAAIELIHKQPVRWTNQRIIACDGGGGPLGHPRIFINVDKPQICWCTYCGLPYAHTHHKKYLQSLPNTAYPLEPIDDPAVVRMPRTPTQQGEIQGQYTQLKGELESEAVPKGEAFSQR